MLLFTILLALASISLCDATDVIGCESNTLDLCCTNGKVIRVLSANYGRTSIFPCFIYFGADNCKAANSTQIVSHRCNNQQKCTIDVSNDLFGDPCELVPKYLEVNYTCDAIQEEDQVLVTCQDETMILVCPNGLTLDILEADYGRGCNDLCPSPGLRTDLNCSASNSTEILRENCDGFNTCILNVTDEVFGDPCSGVAKYLKVNYTCSAPTTIAPTTSTTLEPTYPTICENDELTINCAAGSLINIIYAFYGRASSTICPYLLSVPSRNCSSPNATQTVSHLCDNLQSCTVTASNNEFGGDPCFLGTRKYLQVEWKCRTETSTACQDSDLTINCPNGTSINVGAALFGRIEENICPGGIVPLAQNQSCISPNATDISIASCDHLQTCTLNASTSVFGDPCPGTRKYLQVNYTCPFTNNTGLIKNGTACQGKTLYMSCPGQVINIINALYGRTSKTICPQLINFGGNCQASGATNKVRQLCEDKESCSVSASIFVFGDPCILTSKYLQVNYTCVDAPSPPPPDTNVATACEGSSAEIHCPAHDVINIVSANYGRTSLLICPNLLGLTTKCISPSATHLVRNQCENLNNCTIGANNNVFGDPCSGVKKYLEIVYTCQPLNPGTVRACQNATLLITCPIGTTIDVVSAQFGRTSNKYCSTSSTSATNCTTSNATSIVRERCDDLQYCYIQANNSLFGNPCGANPSYLEVTYECFEGTPPPFSATSEESSPEEINITVCENTTRSIFCLRGDINIVYANYGRTSANKCTTSPEHVTNCRSSDATEIVRRSCENLKVCAITANSSIYGDPCIGVSKYLEVIYYCEESSSLQGSACENNTLHLSCPSGKAIDIVSVEYGRTNNNICPISNYSSSEYCTSNNASVIVKNSCDDRQNCTVVASNEVLGNVCPAISKYLQVIYKCLISTIYTPGVTNGTSPTPTTKVTTEPTTPNVIHTTVCNGYNIQLNCYSDVINIEYANWGRTSTSICPNGNYQTVNCTQSNTTEIIRRSCENKSSCTLFASSSEYGDPCPRVSKYLEIYYFCTTLEQNTSTTCENSSLTLTCPQDTAIDIIGAVYGRLDNKTCSESEGNIEVTDCSSENATTIIDDICDNKRECTLEASSQLFGDPCNGVPKYLQVNYTCLYSVITTPPTSPTLPTSPTTPTSSTTPTPSTTPTSSITPTPSTTPTPPTTQNITTSSCENGSVQLSCSNGDIIDIIDVVYGRQNNQVCPTSSLVTNCSASDAKATVQHLCDQHQECTVGANNSMFGNPCPGVEKYLQITYACLPGTITTPSPITKNYTNTITTGSRTPTPPTEISVYICENFNLDLNCFDGDVLDIVYANWGRTSADECTGINSSIINCTQPNTTEIVRRSCENKASCSLSATNDEYGDPCAGVSKYLEVVYFCTELKTTTSTVCGNGTLNLSCPRDYTLDIVSVLYGRDNSDACPAEAGSKANCSSAHATTIIEERCDDKNNCSVAVSPGLFGDPCNGVSKYLQVSYMCLYSEIITSPTTPTSPTSPPENFTASSCENGTVQLSCPNGDIDIIDVVYGRQNNQVCPTSSLVTNCSASDAKETVQHLCDDLQECTVGANNSVFGNPCPGVEKYLQITYTCLPGTTPTHNTTNETPPPTPKNNTNNTLVYLCENLNINLNCFDGDVIDIVYANWGRTSAHKCTGINSSIINCTQPNTTEIVRRSCENKASCSLSASSDEYGDPCAGVSKYLEVVYFCTELKTTTSTVCGNGTLNLSCPRDYTLDIVSVLYGRDNSDACPAEAGSKANCSSANATTIIEERCDDKNNCSVAVSPGLFGDPCNGVSKYLQVSYMCLYAEIITSTTSPPSTNVTDEGPTSPEPGKNILTGTSCQGGELLLTCPADDFILIYKANYGSTNADECPLTHNNTNSTCTSNSTATSILSDNCDGLSSCAVNISSELFENPCNGAYKSLEVLYICAKRDTNHTASFNETACENAELNLSCANGGDLNIIKANYGRSSSSICPRIGQDQNTNCTLKNSTLILSESCDGQSSCSINATNSIFGDACPGTYKYLEVEYSCSEKLEVIPSKSTVCQASTLTLTCPVGQQLDIQLAIYGRLSANTCPTNNTNENTNCTALNATSVLSSRCDHAETCSINATSSEFGDPCPTTSKYLEVFYRCSATLQCGLNEQIGCATSCTNRMCGISSNASLCLSKICVQGCVCQKGYVRDPNTGLCLEEKYCPLPGRPCQTHEVFSLCGAGCQASCVEPQPTCKSQCISGYVCKDGFIRDTSTGKCVRSEDCPCS